MLWIPFWAAGVINGVGHWFGYRNTDTKDKSTNIIPWGIIIGGEELHNNHHSAPASSKLSKNWYEFDLGWLYIQMFKHVRLLKLKNTLP
jgi:stearoyl-CoA desaturase (delta-9 desaturase)